MSDTYHVQYRYIHVTLFNYFYFLKFITIVMFVLMIHTFEQSSETLVLWSTKRLFALTVRLSFQR